MAMNLGPGRVNAWARIKLPSSASAKFDYMPEGEHRFLCPPDPGALRTDFCNCPFLGKPLLRIHESAHHV